MSLKRIVALLSCMKTCAAGALAALKPFTILEG